MPVAGAPSPHAAVTFSGVAKRFANGTLALENLDLEIKDGEFVCLLGPSGCGKSTVLRLIAGLTEASVGRIFRTEPSAQQARPPAQRRRRPNIGFVFQEPTLMPWATVIRNVMLPLELHRIRRDTAGKRAAQALKRVGLGGFFDAYPRELSGGMKMRASIARALITDPPLLLLDEPFAALDEITRFRLNDDLLELCRAVGHTVVFVTHSVFESVYLANRIIVMTPRPGRVFAEFAIDAPHPRDRNFRSSPEYLGSCRIVSEALLRAMTSGEPA